IYEGVRSTIGTIEQFSQLAHDVTQSIIDNIPEDSESGEWIDEDAAEGEADKITWQTDPDGVYDTIVKLYCTSEDDGSEKLNMTASIAKKGIGYKGLIIFDTSVNKEDEDDFAKIYLEFDGTKSDKSMTIKAVDFFETPPEGELNSAWIEAVEKTDGSLQVKGSYYIPFADSSFLPNDTTSRVYTFTASAKKDSNAVLNLAFPPASLSDVTDIWDTYSIGAVIKNFYYPELIISLAADTTVNELETQTGIDLTGATIEDLTDGDIDKLLAWFAKNDPDGGLSDFIFITNIVNSAYYTPEGFYGTYSSSGGTLGSKPDWADDYKIEDISPLVPSKVANLSFDSENFTIN
ncbi:MAG: hypothetical protein JXA96_01355, partial [Sedimentisphaerales bacterium]|nr:hypothetical protein [Sedimentisphaerales bacterium]